MKEQLAGLDALSINFGSSGMMIVNIILAFVMFGVALGIKLDTFKDVLMKPKSLIVGVLLQWFALPFITFVLAIALGHWITPMIALGMILVASCPGGNISNFMSSWAKGNIELSVSMTAITTAFAPFITPLNFWLWGSLYYQVISVKQDVPTLIIPFLPMLGQILLLLGVPIVLGMLCSKYFPKMTQKITKPAQVISIILFMGMIVVSFSQNFTLFIENIFYVFFIVMIHNAFALSTGYFGGRLFKLPVRDIRSLTVEVGIQNSGLGLVLLFNPKIFPPEIWHGFYGGMLFITAWWGIWHIVSGLTVSTIFRRKKLPEEV
ncbi:MAG: bile acid:sodium symporter family protein [Bacteroidales bacterium]|nr:bile acid:sodium symporter family protein [Bacteroidales bacterium]MBO7255844.1 bile acid:sodium symporter family protein [Bacteroidales bacterium]MBO7284898.1 bile acid:sodium symporter family protein [Bacteroidales bacterium]MBO7322994.1 bile acid:sodium symporter family protein [Bacteroidales bacterium]